MYSIGAIVRSEDEVDVALEALKDRMKNMLWEECWRDAVEMDGVEESVERLESGCYRVSIRYNG